MQLRYGTNSHQPAAIELTEPGNPPFRLISGAPSYINILDAVSAWQVVREASATFGVPAATSFKHVSPAGADLAAPIDAAMGVSYGLDPSGVGDVTSAYVRARDADPKSSFGDFVAVSHPVGAELAVLLRRLPCDGIIAPGFEEGVVSTLAAKWSPTGRSRSATTSTRRGGTASSSSPNPAAHCAATK
jgi:phosphoribosylaminoimidazolecarboxamide formyltransferase/IMP cyclohydrolase